MSEERSFEELLKEESSVTIHNGAIVEGTVISVNENEIDRKSTRLNSSHFH